MKKELSFQRVVLGQIEKCYAVLGLTIAGEPCLVYGGEGNGSLRCFRLHDRQSCDVIWEGGGGTMSIVPLPGHGSEFLASRGFYSMVDSAGSAIEHVAYRNGTFTHRPIARLDYLHRFDTLHAPDGTRYIAACSLHGGKQDKDDWSKPGHLYVGVLPEEILPETEVSLTQLPGDYYQNHGFCKAQRCGRDAAYFTSREGIFAALPPEKKGGKWQVERLWDEPVSDIAVCDLDGDGECELACLLPFHGDRFVILRRAGSGYETVYEHGVKNDFYHAVISGTVKGEKVFAVGARKGEAELFLARGDAESGSYFTQRLDAGPGPSNLALFHDGENDLLLSADRMIAEASVYVF